MDYKLYWWWKVLFSIWCLGIFLFYFDQKFLQTSLRKSQYFTWIFFPCSDEFSASWQEEGPSPVMPQPEDYFLQDPYGVITTYWGWISLYHLGEGVQPGNLNFQSKSEGYKTRCSGFFCLKHHTGSFTSQNFIFLKS